MKNIGVYGIFIKGGSNPPLSSFIEDVCSDIKALDITAYTHINILPINTLHIEELRISWYCDISLLSSIYSYFRS